MPSQLHVLKSNASLIAPTPERPYYTIEMTNSKTGCRLSIAATKPLPDPLLSVKAKPTDYVSVEHVKGKCYCAEFSTERPRFFRAWRLIHDTLRHKDWDSAAHAFYPDFAYEEGEALAHASLVASLALGKKIPECYRGLIYRFGAANLQPKTEYDDYDYDSAEEHEEEPPTAPIATA
ncbi:hypothetical protein F5Y01DRAFT_314068 [Xylaria sp. FL0043]|nr:hypothetical protein F5Y01DRAFT_314068 [Xylaria sp. FL0043]